jgi:hypothetical protein
MKKLNLNVPSTLGLIVDVLLIVQLAINLYRTFKPKTKETETSRDDD